MSRIHGSPSLMDFVLGLDESALSDGQQFRTLMKDFKIDQALDDDDRIPTETTDKDFIDTMDEGLISTKSRIFDGSLSRNRDNSPTKPSSPHEDEITPTKPPQESPPVVKEVASHSIGSTVFISPFSLPLTTLAQLGKSKDATGPNSGFESPPDSTSPGSPSENNIFQQSPSYYNSGSQTDFVSDSDMSDNEVFNLAESLKYNPQLISETMENKSDTAGEMHSRMKNLLEQNEELVEQLAIVAEKNEERRQALMVSETKRSRVIEESKGLLQKVKELEKENSELKVVTHSQSIEFSKIEVDSLQEIEKLREENANLQRLLDPSITELNNNTQIEYLKGEIRSLQEVISSLTKQVKESGKSFDEELRNRDMEFKKRTNIAVSQVQQERKELEKQNFELNLRVKELESISSNSKQLDQESVESRWKELLTRVNEEKHVQRVEFEGKMRELEYSLGKIIDDQKIEILSLRTNPFSGDQSVIANQFKETQEQIKAKYEKKEQHLRIGLEQLQFKNMKLSEYNDVLKIDIASLNGRIQELTTYCSDCENRIRDLDVKCVLLEGDLKKEKQSSSHYKNEIEMVLSQKENIQNTFDEHTKRLRITIEEQEVLIQNLKEEKLSDRLKLTSLQDEMEIQKSNLENLKQLCYSQETTHDQKRINQEKQMESLKERYERIFNDMRIKQDEILLRFKRKEKDEEQLKNLLKEKILESQKIEENLKYIRDCFLDTQNTVNVLVDEVESIANDSQSVHLATQKEIEHIIERNISSMQKNENILDILQKKESDLEFSHQREEGVKEKLSKVKSEADQLEAEYHKCKHQLLHVSVELSKEQAHKSLNEKTEASLRNEIRDLSANNSKLMYKIEELKSEKEILAAKLQKVTSKHADEMNQRDGKLAHLKEELENTLKNQSSTKHLLENLNSKLKEANEDISKLCSLNNSLEKERDLLRLEVKTIEDHWRHKLSEVNVHINKIEEISKEQEQQLEKDRRNFNIQLHEKELAISHLENHIQLLSSTNTMCDETQQSQLRLLNSRLEMKISALELEVKNLMDELDTNKTQIRSLREEKNSLTSLLSQVKYQLVTTQNDKENMKTVLKQRLDQQEDTIRQLHDQLASNVEYLESCRETIKRNQQEQIDQANIISQLTSEIQEKGQQVSKLQKQNDFLSSKYETEIKSLEARFTQMTNELLEMKDQNEGLLKRNVSKLTHSYAEVQVQSLEKEKNSLSVTVQNLQAALKTAQQRIKSSEQMGNDYEKVQSELDKMFKLYHSEKRKVILLEKELEKHKVRELDEQNKRQ